MSDMMNTLFTQQMMRGSLGSHGGGFGVLAMLPQTEGVFREMPGLMGSNIAGLGSLFTPRQPAKGIAAIFAEMHRQLSEMNSSTDPSHVFGHHDISPPNTPSVGGGDHEISFGA